MAKTFTRIGKDIVIAVKEGGPHPDSNARLRQVMQNAKSANMLKTMCEPSKRQAIRILQTMKISLEGYAVHGIAIY